MKTRLVSLSTALVGAALCSACTGTTSSLPDTNVTDPLADVMTSDDPAIAAIALTRSAIYRGLGVGDAVLVAALNGVLLDHTIPYVIETLDDLEPPAPDTGSCPYIENLANDASAALSCRYIVERARDASYIDVSGALAAAPLGPEYLAAGDLAEHELWYGRGALSGIDGSYARAIETLRTAGVCDQAPGAVESSFTLGVEHGRALMALRLVAQVAVTPASMCDIDNGIVAPARAAAIVSLDDYVANNPLCPDADLGTIDDLLEFAQAEMEYRRGISTGIEEQAVIEAQNLLDTWVCVVPPAPEGGGGGPAGGTGDPIILDLDGDGVAFTKLGAGPRFDLDGEGRDVRTAWVTGDDALLVLDRDHDGRIGSGAELFGDRTRGPAGARYRSGFEALATLDEPALGGDGNGVLDPRDALFAELRVWRDDGDGVTEEGELSDLLAAGVAAVSLAATACADGETGDALIAETASFLRLDGSEGTVIEAFLTVSR